jgi:hypothetical protein
MIKKVYFSILFLFYLTVFSQTDSIQVKFEQSDTSISNFNIPIFSTTGADAESEIDQQDVSSLLQSSKDVFIQFSSFQFGAARFRMRGYSAENQQIMINGVNVNNLETGFSSWSSWGGLNDVTRYTENRFGNVSNRYGFSGVGGYTNIDSKASSFKKGTRVSYVNANRAFANRFMVTHSTGMQQNGWALTLSASSRYGDQVYVPGTYFNANAFYLSVDKKITDKHLLSFTGFVAPIEQGRSSAAQIEAYQLTGDNYYNSLWGYQNGKVRNSSVSKTQRPMFLMSHIFKPSSESQLVSTLFYTFGKSSLSSLNWNNVSNPRPDYYRYLPSYSYQNGDTAFGDRFKLNWQNDVNTRQINWDRLIAVNQANLYTLPSQLGNSVNSSETRARYILEERIEDLKNIGFNTVYNKRIEALFLSAGFNANLYSNRKYKEMADLLGATYWLDYDQFAQNLGVDPIYQQNDIETPDKKIVKGDRFGYDYIIHVNRVEAWSQLEYTLKNLDIYAGLSLSNNVIWREGFIKNGKFPSTSKGLSDKLNFINYGLKGGLTYKISGRHFLTANGSLLSRAPEVNNLFTSPRVRNDLISGVLNELVTSTDINYSAKFPGFKLRLTYYFTQINNQTWVRSYFDDTYNNNVNLIMKSINQQNQGIEIGVEKTIFTSHLLQLCVGLGEYIYTNRPVLEAWQDNNAAPLYNSRKAYLTNFKVGGSPQSVFGLGYKYTAKKYWYAGLYLNYFDQIYIEANPNRRTEESLSNYLVNEKEQYSKIINQEQLPAYYILNANAGKSFRLFKKYMLNLSLNINNILNNKTSITSGYEQLRFVNTNIDKFANKYYYMTGTTYMATINFTF